MYPRWVPYVFVAPFAVLLVVFGIGPAAFALWMSFQRDDGTITEFAALDNFARVLTDERALDAAGNVGTFILILLPTMAIVTVGLGLLTHARPGRFSSAMRMAYYLPGAISGSAVALVWLFMLSPGISPFNWLLQWFGAESVMDMFTLDSLPFVFTVMMVAMTAGGWTLVIYGALSSVSADVLEAARIDGASAWQLARHIKLPLVRRHLVFMLILSFSAGIQIVAEPAVINAALPSTVDLGWSISQLAAEYVLLLGDLGAGAALSLMLFAVSLTVTLVLVFKTGFYRTDMDRR